MWTVCLAMSFFSIRSLSISLFKSLYIATLLSFVSLNRAEGEPAGHVRWEVQTFQRHQVHDQGWQVPGPDIKTSSLLDNRIEPPQDWGRGREGVGRVMWREVGDESWYIPCCICITGLTYTNRKALFVAVKNGPLHIEKPQVTALTECRVWSQHTLPLSVQNWTRTEPNIAHICPYSISNDTHH